MPIYTCDFLRPDFPKYQCTPPKLMSWNCALDQSKKKKMYEKSQWNSVALFSISLCVGSSKREGCPSWVWKRLEHSGTMKLRKGWPVSSHQRPGLVLGDVQVWMLKWIRHWTQLCDHTKLIPILQHPHCFCVITDKQGSLLFLSLSPS